MNEPEARDEQGSRPEARREELPPWDEPSFLLPAPTDGSYGYVSNQGWRRCQLAELMQVLREDESLNVPLVWTPETPRLTPPEEVPYLFSAVKERSRKITWRRLRRSLTTGAIVALFVFPMLLQEGMQRQFGLVVLTAIVVLPLLHGLWSLRQVKRLTPERITEQGALARLGLWLSTRSWNATKYILVCIGVVGVAQLLFYLLLSNDPESGYSSVMSLALIKSRVLEGEAWRLLTAIMAHGNILHIAFNCLALKVLGRQLEGFTDSAYVPIVFLVSALVGCGFSLALMDLHQLAGSIGASGGVIGLIGFMAVLFVRRRRQLPRGLVFETFENIGLIAVIGVVGFQVIDNAGHFGGLLGGVVLGLILVPRDIQQLPIVPSRVTRLLASVCSVIVALAALTAVAQLFLIARQGL